MRDGDDKPAEENKVLGGSGSLGFSGAVGKGEGGGRRLDLGGIGGGVGDPDGASARGSSSSGG